jgi:hypothetical protein
MDTLALLCGWALPWILGVALLQAIPRGPGPRREEAGAIAWSLGCGWFAGIFLLTLWMRCLSAAGVPLGVVAIAVPLGAVSGGAAYVASRRGRRSLRESMHRALSALAGAGLAGWMRVA